LFGATGNCGKAVMSEALSRGYKVKAMVRSKGKVTLENDDLTLVEGDFSNEAAIKETVSEADYVISMAGGPVAWRNTYPKDLILNFTKTLLGAIKDAPSVKSVVLQNGNIAIGPGEVATYKDTFIRKILVKWVLGLDPNIADHESVLHYVEDWRKENASPAVVCIRPPGMDSHKEGVEKGKPVVTDVRNQMDAMSFEELAIFAVDAVENEDVHHKNPFVTLEK